MHEDGRSFKAAGDQRGGEHMVQPDAELAGGALGFQEEWDQQATGAKRQEKGSEAIIKQEEGEWRRRVGSSSTLDFSAKMEEGVQDARWRSTSTQRT